MGLRWKNGRGGNKNEEMKKDRGWRKDEEKGEEKKKGKVRKEGGKNVTWIWQEMIKKRRKRMRENEKNEKTNMNGWEKMKRQIWI